MTKEQLDKEFEKFHVQKRISGFSKAWARVYFEAGFELNKKERNKLKGENEQLRREIKELSETKNL